MQMMIISDAYTCLNYRSVGEHVRVYELVCVCVCDNLVTMGKNVKYVAIITVQVVRLSDAGTFYFFWPQ